MKLIRYIILALIISAAISDAGIVIIFYRIRHLLDTVAWRLIMTGYVISMFSSIDLIAITILRPRRLIALSLVISFFLLYTSKQIIWFFGIKKFAKDLKF